ncbi:unnamed protein product, partial [Oppiella nova]
RNEEECQLILQYIHNTTHYGKAIVKSVYRVNRNGEEKAFDGTGVDNRWLLWHGTRAANVLSILAKGLQKSPLSAEISGHLFGKGVYFADMFTKSQGYSSSGAFGQKFMFLSEVSLGAVQDVRIRDLLEKPYTLDKDKHSLKASHTQYTPDPQSSVYWKGRRLSITHL